MEHVDLQYKEAPPSKTVERIRTILSELGIEIQEEWHDSGIENCQSLTLSTPGSTLFTSNGKGVSRDLARASAYGEFIERLQCGLNFYKYQSIGRDPEMILHSFAPDAKYMTLQELEETGDWMDHVIRSYPNLTRKTLANHCKAYACTEEDKILTLPYYSLFENKYVYLPAGYVEYMYTANGCCVGNTREEAWIHAISEIFERKSSINVIKDALSLPVIDESVISQFPTVSKILRTIRQESSCDVQFLDFSLGMDYPVVAARLIDRKTHRYIVNVGADPILEIALERTLTELFQGRHLHTFNFSRSGILETENPIPTGHNITNFLQTGDGAFPLSFFAEELLCDKVSNSIPDFRGKSNQEILPAVLDICKNLGHPLYIRNYSFLGFPCYKLVIPGFSETYGSTFAEKIPEYALGDIAARVLRNVETASDSDLKLLLMYYQKISTRKNTHYSLAKLAGLPLSSKLSRSLLPLILSYVCWRLKQDKSAISYLDAYVSAAIDEESAQYFACLSLYMKLKLANSPEDQIRLVLSKFFEHKYPQLLFSYLDNGHSPYGSYLLRCDYRNCSSCRYRSCCTYTGSKQIVATLGNIYADFSNGQDPSQFTL